MMIAFRGRNIQCWPNSWRYALVRADFTLV
jgi:hypothetical protein